MMVVFGTVRIAPALLFSLTVIRAIICAVTFKTIINIFSQLYDKTYIFNAVDFFHIHM